VKAEPLWAAAVQFPPAPRVGAAAAEPLPAKFLLPYTPTPPGIGAPAALAADAHVPPCCPHAAVAGSACAGLYGRGFAPGAALPSAGCIVVDRPAAPPLAAPMTAGCIVMDGPAAPSLATPGCIVVDRPAAPPRAAPMTSGCIVVGRPAALLFAAPMTSGTLPNTRCRCLKPSLSVYLSVQNHRRVSACSCSNPSC
jgi:hypothetical protein